MRSRRRILRDLGRGIVIAGLAVFYGSLVFSVLGADPPGMLLLASAIATTVGCLWLTAVLVWAPGHKERGGFEATLAFLCLPAALLAVFGASESGLRPSWVVVAVFFVIGVVVLLVQAAQARRKTDAWRNTGLGGS